MYIITNGSVRKQANSKEDAQKVFAQMQAIVGGTWRIKEYKDIWDINKAA